MSEKHNAAIIRIPKDYLLKMLDFEGGIIHSVRVNPEYWRAKEIEIVIEHPDLPEIEPGMMLYPVQPMYLTHCHVVQVDDQNEKAVTYEKIERIDPPKKEVPDAALRI